MKRAILLIAATALASVQPAFELYAQGRRATSPPSAPAGSTVGTPGALGPNTGSPSAMSALDGRAESPEETIRRTTSLLEAGGLPLEARQQALRVRAHTYAITGRRGLAMADVTTLLQLDSGDAEAYFVRGIADFVGNPRAAAQSFSEVLRRQPERADAYRGRGWAYILAGENERAEEDFARLLRMDSDDGEALRGRGWSRLNAGRYDLAVQDFAALLRLHPAHGEAFVGRGLAHLFAGRAGEAREDFRSSMRIQPPRDISRPSFRFDDHQRYRRALTILEQRMERNRTDFDAWLASGAVGYRQFDDTGSLMTDLFASGTAKSSLDGILRIRPDMVDALMFRAMLFSTQGRAIYNRSAAIADLTEVIRLQPTHAEAHFRRALLLAIDKTMLDAAIADCERALAMAPGNPVLIQVLEKLRTDKAEWERAAQQAAIEQERRDAAQERAAILFFAGVAVLIATADPGPAASPPAGTQPQYLLDWQWDLKLNPPR